jgi:hypothetical protein
LLFRVFVHDSEDMRLQLSSGSEKKGPMKVFSKTPICAHLVWLVFCSAILFGQQSNTSEHQRNFSNCRNGSSSCDRSQLSDTEATALAVAEHRLNVSNCENGFTSCDHSRLTVVESRNIAVLEHQRNLAGCESGIGSCDDLKLTASEVNDWLDANTISQIAGKVLPRAIIPR